MTDRLADDLRAAAFDPLDAALVTALVRAADDLGDAIPEDTARAHLAAIVAAAGEHAHVAPAAPALRAAAVPGALARPRRLLGMTAVKWVLGAGVAAAATGGLAANDRLPAPVQRVVSDSVQWFGVDWPHPNRPAAPQPAETEGDPAGPAAPQTRPGDPSAPPSSSVRRSEGPPADSPRQRPPADNPNPLDAPPGPPDPLPTPTDPPHDTGKAGAPRPTPPVTKTDRATPPGEGDRPSDAGPRPSESRSTGRTAKVAD